MAWQTVSYRLTSSAPFIMHNGQMADPLNKWSKLLKQITSKRIKTDADHEEMARIEFMGALYMNEEGPIVPSYMIDALAINGAKKSKEGMIAKSGCFCLSHSRLEYIGPRTANELWADEQFRFVAIVVRNRARIVCTRPIFHEYNFIATLNVEDTQVNPARVFEWLTIAGTQVGIGDWRPQYGRFTVERLNGNK